MEDVATPQGLLAVEEYLELEASSAITHEYVGGMLYALAGDSDRHNRIAGNTYIAFRAAARRTHCRVYMSDMRLRVGANFYYPDVMVACEEPETDNPTFRNDACVVVEVLSVSTESIDRREKLLAYRELPTLQAYLIVHQDIRRVERFFHGEDAVWQRADRVKVPCRSRA